MQASRFAHGDATGLHRVDGTSGGKGATTTGSAGPQGIAQAIGVQFEKAADAIDRPQLCAAKSLDGSGAVAGSSATGEGMSWGLPAVTDEPDCGKVMSDFTGMDSMMHMSASATAVPGATGEQGTR